VLLIDADLRRPGLHEMFDLPNAQGLTTLIRNNDARLETVVQRTEQANLSVMCAGPLPPNPAEVLGSKRMESAVATLSAHYELLIFDSAPVEMFADSAVLGSFLDGTLLVVDAARSHRAPLLRAAEALAKAKANVFGVVLNRLPSSTYAGYGSYYGPRAEVAAGVGADSGRTA
jgi:capsular exopolysaccharide synthesis family protein